MQNLCNSCSAGSEPARLQSRQGAIEQWHRAQGASALDAALARLEVEQWLARNPVDTHWIISRIWRAEIDLGLAC